MFNGSTGYSLSDLATAVGGRNGSGFLGGADGAWWLIILIVLFGGWGYGANGYNAPAVSNVATRSDISDGFALDNINTGIRGIQNGICDSTYALNNTIQNGFANNQLQLSQNALNAQLQSAQGVNTLQAGINDLGFALQSSFCQSNQNVTNGFNNLNFNLASQICDVKTQIANSTRDMIDNANANTRSILDYMVQTKMSEKDAKITQLTDELSQTRQSAFLSNAITAQTTQLLGAINPTAIPAYVVNPPCQTASYCSCCNQ